ncbi:MAG: hypothetical protein GEV03_01200 [Streptosporangiales bacterium]|nr:hypothetical protein [Streptosporangiales bacterium]
MRQVRVRGAPIGTVFAAMALVAALVSGCAADPSSVAAQERDPAGRGHAAGNAAASPVPRVDSAPAGFRVAPLAERVRPDLLVQSTKPIPKASLRRLRDAPGVTQIAVIGLGSTALRGESVTVAAVDPSTYRAFAPEGTAESDAVWQAVARGEAAVAHATGERLRLPLGGTAESADGRLPRIGVFATTVPGVDVVVEPAAGDRFGVPDGNGVVVGTGSTDPSEVASRLRRMLGDDTHVKKLTGTGAGASGGVSQMAFLTGDDAARAFGTFRYRWLPNGGLWIDPAFVRENIRTERVPILGEVRCHRLMLPQLRGALQEVVDRGLANKIHPGEYGGCFVPKGIEGSPGAISLHTWGIAIDINVPGNLRGTSGEIDRQVVAIFKRWGFAWGGDWSWTDPMHFELAGVLTNPP